MWTKMVFAASLVASLVATAFCAVFTGGRDPGSRVPLVAEAPEAGMIAVATPGSGRVRVLYARNGGMVLLRELWLREGDTVSAIAISSDGTDLVIGTSRGDYMVSTRLWDRHPLRNVALAPAALLSGKAL